ncbi:MAG: hypothetical protein ACI9JR_003101 [Gammaproteobacteria bacterium]|jgi:hypothetical protein
MTAQMGERLDYQGKEYSMCSEPLNKYFAYGGDKPEFGRVSTALWRCYIGSWEIIDNRLYMTGISASLEDGTAVKLEMLFPGFTDLVFAHWYSGTLRVPDGNLLNYRHAGYDSEYERDILIEVGKGLVTETTIRENGNARNLNAPEGYGAAAAYVFPEKGKGTQDD